MAISVFPFPTDCQHCHQTIATHHNSVFDCRKNIQRQTNTDTRYNFLSNVLTRTLASKSRSQKSLGRFRTELPTLQPDGTNKSYNFITTLNTPTCMHVSLLGLQRDRHWDVPPLTPPWIDSSINLPSSQTLVAKDNDTTTNLPSNPSLCLLIHSASPQAPLNLSPSPLFILRPHFLNSLLFSCRHSSVFPRCSRLAPSHFPRNSSCSCVDGELKRAELFLKCITDKDDGDVMIWSD